MAQLNFDDMEEPKVRAIEERLFDPADGKVKFKTLWEAGDVTYEPSDSFIDENGMAIAHRIDNSF